MLILIAGGEEDPSGPPPISWSGVALAAGTKKGISTGELEGLIGLAAFHWSCPRIPGHRLVAS